VSKYNSRVQRVVIHDPVEGDLPYEQGVQRVLLQDETLKQDIAFLAGGDQTPILDYVAGTITFPIGEADWILYVGGQHYTHFINGSLAAPLVFDFAAEHDRMGTSAIVLMYNTVQDSFSFTAWSNVNLVSNSVIIATSRNQGGRYHIIPRFPVIKLEKESLTAQPSFSRLSGAFEVSKNDNICLLSGVIKRVDTTSRIITILPQQYRPKSARYVTVSLTSNKTDLLTISTNGEVSITFTTAANDNLYLDSVVYRID
jgi:hypothetical protein